MSAVALRPGSLLEQVQRETAGRPRIAVLRASRLGDFVCGTPALRALRLACPGAEVTLIALPYLRDAAEALTNVDRFLPFPGYPGIAEQFFEPSSVIAFWRQAQARSFDLALQLHGSGVYANSFTLMLASRYTAGFVRPGDGQPGLSLAVPFPETGREPQRVSALVHELGVDAPEPPPEFPLTEQARAEARRLLAGLQRPLLGLHVGALEEAKQAPAGLMGEAARLAQEATGATVLLLGTAADSAAGRAVALRLGGPCHDLCGCTSLLGLGAVIEALDALVGNDSGPAHIARALDTPSLTIFETTDPERWGPSPSPRHRVLLRPRSPREVADVLVELLARGDGEEQRRR